SPRRTISEVASQDVTGRAFQRISCRSLALVRPLARRSGRRHYLRRSRLPRRARCRSQRIKTANPSRRMNPVPGASTSSPSATTETTLSPALFGVALLLSISVLVNYVDRGTLAIAAPLLKEDLHLSASQLGILLSAFFWTYGPFQVVSGWLVDKFN